MNPEDMSPSVIYVWTTPNDDKVKVRFIQHVPSQAPIHERAPGEGVATFPGVDSLRPRCTIEEVGTGHRHDVWLDELSEHSD